jgi:hypothetical protein
MEAAVEEDWEEAVEVVRWASGSEAAVMATAVVVRYSLWEAVVPAKAGGAVSRSRWRSLAPRPGSDK